MPKLSIALAFFMLVALASTMTYTGFLVVGVVAEHLGTGRFLAGLLLGLLFARFPRISKGKFRTVGLLPKPARRPILLSLLALCLAYFVWGGDYVSASFIGFAAAFLLSFPWLRRAIFARLLASISQFVVGKKSPTSIDPTVIDGEFREKKE